MDKRKKNISADTPVEAINEVTVQDSVADTPNAPDSTVIDATVSNTSDTPAPETVSEETVQNADGEQVKTDLGDMARVKVISPGRLVVKRFMRNRLAIVGACILIFMFIFAFLGPVFSPYTESQTFVKYEGTRTDYISGTFETTATYYGDTSDTLTGTQVAKLSETMKSIDVGGEAHESVGGVDFTVRKTYDNICSVEAARSSTANVATYTAAGGVQLEAAYRDVVGLADAIVEHLDDGSFEHDGKTYTVTKGRFNSVITTTEVYEFGGMLSTYSVYFNELLGSESAEDILPDFTNNGDALLKGELIKSIVSGRFEYDGVDYIAVRTDDGDYEFVNGDSLFAFVSTVRVVSARGTNEVFVTVVKDFVAAIRKMADDNVSEYSYEGNAIVVNDSTEVFERVEGAEIEIALDRSTYTSKVDMTRMLLDLNASPSKEHWLGTDGNGMDNLTRMMYGGRVSLMVGFIVIIIEVVIGIIMGGIAGYFGGWVDMLIMRIVDIFNCIPFMPVMIILGAVFDSLMLNPWLRIIYIMMIMGLVSWTGVARLVRGQILSLREQEFMQAAEATGISVPRRIFKHLVPNVMPQLIVSATMGLGDVIITESTLSFLGLGCKYPMSSWGTIINSVNTKFGLLNYTYVWIPVGLLISLTVIAFNFIGDGLRDAFDPKMKR